MMEMHTEICMDLTHYLIFLMNWKFEFEVFINNNKEPDADWIDSDKKFGDYSVRLDGEKLSGNVFLHV